MNPTDLIDAESVRDDIPAFAPGDTLKVHVRVVEGNKERVQVFQGVVIRRQGSGIRETFTVRKVSYGVGVERTFPVHSPVVARIDSTMATRFAWLSCRADKLTDTLTGCMSAHWRAWRHAASRTHAPTATIKPVSSATPMKSLGLSRPRDGWAHRTSASTPVMRSSISDTIGW